MTMQTNGNGQALAKPTKNDLKSFLDSPNVRAKLVEAAGKLMKPEDLIRFALMASSRQPELATCTRESVLRSLLDAAALGIKPGGLMGRGYLIPRRNKGKLECTFDPGWRGLVDIARRSGQIRRIEAHVVYEKDGFSYSHSPLTTIRHEPTEDANPGKVRAAYAVAEFADGSLQIEVVLKRDLDKIRKMASSGGPWSGDWEGEMARKTAVRRICKYLPYDEALDRAMLASDGASDGADLGIEVSAAPVRGGRKSSLEARLAERGAERGAEPDMLPPAEESGTDVEHDPETGEVTERQPGDDSDAERAS